MKLIVIFASFVSVSIVPSSLGVAVISKLGDFWEFADDWNHFPGTAPFFPHSGTRWPRASPSPSTEVRAPAVSPQPEVRKRHVRYVAVPVVEVPLEVEIPVELLERQPKKATPRKAKKEEESAKNVARNTRDLEGAPAHEKKPAAVVRVVRQDFGGHDSGSGEVGLVTAPSPVVRFSQPERLYGDQPRSVSYDDQPRSVAYDGYGGDDYAYKPARYEFGYVARAAGPRGNYGRSAGYDNNDDGYGSAAEFGHRERRNGHNTQGAYFADLPDGRRQRVDYYVDGDSGYVARVAYSPIGGSYDGRGPAFGGSPGSGSDSLEDGK